MPMIQNEFIDILSRNLIRCNGEPIPKAVEAIIRSNKNELLQKFLSQTDEVEIIDGSLVNQGENIPVMNFSIKGLALRCATTLVQVGVRASKEECHEIMRIAFINDDLEAMECFLDNEDNNTLTKYLFKVKSSTYSKE